MFLHFIESKSFAMIDDIQKHKYSHVHDDSTEQWRGQLLGQYLKANKHLIKAKEITAVTMIVNSKTFRRFL